MSGNVLRTILMAGAWFAFTGIGCGDATSPHDPVGEDEVDEQVASVGKGDVPGGSEETYAVPDRAAETDELAQALATHRNAVEECVMSHAYTEPRDELHELLVLQECIRASNESLLTRLDRRRDSGGTGAESLLTIADDAERAAGELCRYTGPANVVVPARDRAYDECLVDAIKVNGGLAHEFGTDDGRWLWLSESLHGGEQERLFGACFATLDERMQAASSSPDYAELEAAAFQELVGCMREENLSRLQSNASEYAALDTVDESPDDVRANLESLASAHASEADARCLALVEANPAKDSEKERLVAFDACRLMTEAWVRRVLIDRDKLRDF